jgi:uncharacterized damage-inducible protein DinB
MMSRELASLRGDLELAHAGDPWYGSSRRTVLSDVTFGEATTRASANAHSIWQLVSHMEAWTREVTRRLRGNDAAEPEMGDWPPVRETGEEAWKNTLRSLDEAHQELMRVLDGFPDEKLHEPVGDARNPALGTGVTYAGMLRGLVQHDAYHVGQIAMLKKVMR